MFQLARASSRRIGRVVGRRQYHIPETLVDDITQRGLVSQITRPDDLKRKLEEQCTVYLGIDPTASSMHVGHLLPYMVMVHFQIRGHRVLPLIGGATGRLGDPSGRATEREPSKDSFIQHNAELLETNVTKFFARAEAYAATKYKASETSRLPPEVLNNLTWWKDVNMLSFLQNVGSHIRLNYMLSKDSVKLRLDSQNGMTFGEFTYQLLQGYDFYELFRRKGCTIQIGGSDQWGNILTGLEMINRVPEEGAEFAATVEKGFGITTPLLTTSSGDKFGKSAGNAVWLDETRTSVLDFYQFFLKTADADVEKYLNIFTLLEREYILALVTSHNDQPDKRLAQRRLAEEVTELVHGPSAVTIAKMATKVLFDANYTQIVAQDFIEAMGQDPRLVLCEEVEGVSLSSLASQHGLTASGKATRKLIEMGGLYVNNERVTDPKYRLSSSDLLDGRLVILRAGKDRHLVVAKP